MLKPDNTRPSEALDAPAAPKARFVAVAPIPMEAVGARAFRDASRLFALCRRHDLPFGLLVVSLRGGSRSESAWDELRGLVAALARESDVWAPTEEGHLVVFCPVSTPEGVSDLGERIRAAAEGLAVCLGTASFRVDGLRLPDLLERASERAFGDGDPVPRVVPLRIPGTGRRSRLDAAVKRAFDLALVASAAPLWLPLAAIVAAVVKLSDPRAPVLFSQKRTGLGGRRFRMHKFRTMVPEAEGMKAALLERSERSWPDFKIDDDPRITRVGRALRASSLDELPQLWNVLRGDMSLVGPRPTSFSSDTYEAWHTARLEVVPGLTGLWQVEARGCQDFAERIRLDLRYVENRGFWYDLRILLRTVPAVLWNREGR